MSNGISIEVTRKFESEREGEDLVLDVNIVDNNMDYSTLMIFLYKENTLDLNVSTMKGLVECYNRKKATSGEITKEDMEELSKYQCDKFCLIFDRVLCLELYNKRSTLRLYEGDIGTFFNAIYTKLA